MTCKGGVFTVKVATEEMLQTSYQMMKRLRKTQFFFPSKQNSIKREGKEGKKKSIKIFAITLTTSQGKLRKKIPSL